MNSVKIGKVIFYLCATMIVFYGVAVGVMRIYAPFQFDVFEGKVLCEAYESSLGNPVYHDPDLPGAPTVYTPLYPLFVGLFLRFLPPLFLWGRVISTICFIGIIWLSVKTFYRDVGRNTIGIVALITAMISTLWKTDWICVLHKPDAMSVFLWLAGLLLLINEKKFSDAIAALLIAGAFFAKQTAILVLPGTLIYLWLDKPRRAVLFFLEYFTLWFVWCGIVYIWAGDHVFFYVFRRMWMKIEYSFPLSQIFHYALAPRELPFIVLCVFIAICGVMQLWEIKSYRLLACNIPFVYIGSVMTAASWTAGANSMLPFYVIASLLGGFAFAIIPELWREKVGLYWLMTMLMIMQFDSKMPYHVSKSLGRFDKEFVELVEFLKKQNGSMYCPSDNVITLLAGKHNYEDIFLAWEIDPSNSTGRVQRVKDRINACDVTWLILHKTEIQPGTLKESTAQVYEKKSEFGDWEVYRKKP